VYELAAGGIDVPKHVGVLKDNSSVFVVCASGWFYKYSEQKCSLFSLTVLCSVITAQCLSYQSMSPNVRS
jgi:hypothetical protein